MGDTYDAATPRGRVNEAQRAYANREINAKEMDRRLRAEGYERTASLDEVKERWGKRRGRRQ